MNITAKVLLGTFGALAMTAFGAVEQALAALPQGIVLAERTPRTWWVGFAVAFALVMLLNYAITWLLVIGVGIWGINSGGSTTLAIRSGTLVKLATLCTPSTFSTWAVIFLSFSRTAGVYTFSVTRPIIAISSVPKIRRISL